jgi:hypothetical protein
MRSLVKFDVAEARIDLHPDKSHRQLSSSRLANRRLHAYHSVIAMSLLHPALLILTLFIVLRLRSMKIKLPFKLHHKQLHHSTYGAVVGKPRLTLKTIVVMFKNLLVILHAYHSLIAISQLHPVLLILTIFIIRSMLNFHIKWCHYSYGAGVGSKGGTTRPRLTLKTTVVMLVYGEKGEMHLLVIIHQRLILSGDVELNPGPLGGEQLLGVCYCIPHAMYKLKWVHGYIHGMLKILYELV